jgi:hypothetical protein
LTQTIHGNNFAGDGSLTTPTTERPRDLNEIEALSDLVDAMTRSRWDELSVDIMDLDEGDMEEGDNLDADIQDIDDFYTDEDEDFESDVE